MTTGVRSFAKIINLIRFENDGRLLISKELDISVKEQFLLPEKIKAFSVESYCYLEWHRKNLLR